MGSFPNTYNDPSIVKIILAWVKLKTAEKHLRKFHSSQSETVCNTKLKILKVTLSPLMQPAKEYHSPHLKSINYFNQKLSCCLSFRSNATACLKGSYSVGKSVRCWPCPAGNKCPTTDVSD